MTEGWPAVALGAGFVFAALSARIAVRWAPERLTKSNYAGRPVPVVLGLCLALAVVSAFWVGVGVTGGSRRPSAVDVAVVAVAAGLCGVGFLDDLFGGDARGLVGHVRRLLAGRPTTGILKLLAGVGGAISIAWLDAGATLRIVAGAVLIAVAVNVWNALDVVPGRALKWAGLALVALVPVTWDRPFGLLATGTAGALLAVLPLDLRERGMLGDAGSNPLGLLIGAGLFLALPTPGVLAAAAVVLGLQVAAETITISRLIEAVPPVSWLDKFGRSAEPEESSAKVKSRGD